MNKTSIKNYAIWARNELISRVSQKAFEYGVEKDNIVSSNANDINGRLLSNDEKKKRQTLIKEVNQKGYDQVMEEVAYTWFNRFIALRFMEVNNYLPNKVRVFTNDNNEFKPQIMDEALHIDLLGLDKNRVIALKEENNDEELYKELLLATCNDMSQYLPGMFKPIDDYMTLLFPTNLLREESVLGRLISDISEDSWNDQVQIIGWLYQYYISEKHNQVVNINKSTVSK
ncbi:MAG: SAM-dependent methyltransferase, partial [Faecalicoccus sp.]|nr:SAM-dependent methyltransferase [Faecalicoccus sp.]